MFTIVAVYCHRQPLPLCSVSHKITEYYCHWILGIEERHYGIIIIRTLGTNVVKVRKKNQKSWRILECPPDAQKTVPHRPCQSPDAETWFPAHWLLTQEKKNPAAMIKTNKSYSHGMLDISLKPPPAFRWVLLCSPGWPSSEITRVTYEFLQ